MAPRKTSKKPRKQLAGKDVPKPISLAQALAVVQKHRPELLTTLPLGPADAVVGNTIIRGEDPVNHPSHYKGANGLECIDCQEAAVSNSPLDGFAAHLLSTAIGYAFRCGKKGEALQDARKLGWYANRLIAHLEKM